jgi:hypothetical protein
LLRFFEAPLASNNRLSKDVSLEAVIVPELKLRDIERYIFSARLVECAGYTALENRPEVINRVRVGCADNVLLAAAIDHATSLGRFAMTDTPIAVASDQSK